MLMIPGDLMVVAAARWSASPPVPVAGRLPAGRWRWTNLRNGAMPALEQCRKPGSTSSRRVPTCGDPSGGVFVIPRDEPPLLQTCAAKAIRNRFLEKDIFFEN